MPLDESTRRLAFLLQRDMLRLDERERARTDRGESVAFDSVARIATWETKRGEVIGRWFGEIVASYVVRDRILRWAWTGKPPLATPSHVDVIAKEGEARQVPQLAMSVVGDLDEVEAVTLVRLAVLVARGDGLEVRRGEGELTFIGLFDTPRPRASDAPDTRYSMPPPTRSGSPAPETRVGGGAARSFPPVREATATIREPARAVFVPVASAVVALLSKVAAGYAQALFVVTVDGEPHKLRIVVVVAAVDAAGVLRAYDPTPALLEAAGRMVEADRADGNGAWRKLSARITPKRDGGATLHVDVV